MSEEEEVKVEEAQEEPLIITAKDPKKVEQGKRPAAISKEAKERKMRARIKEEDFSYLPWIGYGVSIVSSLTMLWLLFHGDKSESELEKVTIVKTPPPSPVKRKKFENF